MVNILLKALGVQETIQKGRQRIGLIEILNQSDIHADRERKQTQVRRKMVILADFQSKLR